MSTPLATMIREMAAAGCPIEVIAKAVELAEIHARGVDTTVDKTVNKASARTARWRERKRIQNVDKTVDSDVDTGGTIGGEVLSLEIKIEEKKNIGRTVTSVTLPSGEVEDWTDKDIDEAFDEDLWPNFPKRLGGNPKKPAKKKFKALVRGGADPFAIFNGAIQLARDIKRNGTEPQFIPQMITWLNQERWEDGQEQARVRQ